MPYDPHYHARMLLSRVPDEIRKSISTEELNDRLVEAARLGAQANDPALSDELRKAARLRGQAVLQAQPREATRAQHAKLIAKAAATPHRGQAEAIRRQAEELISEQHPIAPPHGAAVRKAKGDDPVPVFDQAGNLVGVCDPDDITPLGSPGGKAPPPASGADVPPPDPGAGGAVAKAVSRCKVVVWDQSGRQYATDRRSIRSSVRKSDDDTMTLYDTAGRAYQVSRSAVQSPEAQARNTGPVNAGGTTGMGQPRVTGPAAALPADGPQARLQGDVSGRQVIKASSLGLPYRTVGEAARERRLAKIEKATGQDLSRPHAYARNPYSPEAHCICEAPSGHRVHPHAAPGIRQVAKSANWTPGLTNPATDKWLAAQRRGNPWPPVAGR